MDVDGGRSLRLSVVPTPGSTEEMSSSLTGHPGPTVAREGQVRGSARLRGVHPGDRSVLVFRLTPVTLVFFPPTTHTCPRPHRTRPGMCAWTGVPVAPAGHAPLWVR